MWKPFLNIKTETGKCFEDGSAVSIPAVFTIFTPNMSFSIVDCEKQVCVDNPKRLRNLVRMRLLGALADFQEILDRRLEEDPEYLEKALGFK